MIRAADASSADITRASSSTVGVTVSTPGGV
jgi:hypothetical protein